MIQFCNYVTKLNFIIYFFKIFYNKNNQKIFYHTKYCSLYKVYNFIFSFYVQKILFLGFAKWFQLNSLASSVTRKK